MKISEYQLKISQNEKTIRDLQNQISKLSEENLELNFEKEAKLVEGFLEYLEIGSVYHVKDYLWLTGVRTGIKPGESEINPHFQNGDVFEIVKKNKKSVVIKCTTKVTTTLVTPGPLPGIGGTRTSQETHPNWLFRIDLLSLYNTLVRKDSQFGDSFKKFITRKEALDSIGI